VHRFVARPTRGSRPPPTAAHWCRCPCGARVVRLTPQPRGGSTRSRGSRGSRGSPASNSAGDERELLRSRPRNVPEKLFFRTDYFVDRLVSPRTHASSGSVSVCRRWRQNLIDADSPNSRLVHADQLDRLGSGWPSSRSQSSVDSSHRRSPSATTYRRLSATRTFATATCSSCNVLRWTSAGRTTSRRHRCTARRSSRRCGQSL